MPPLLKEPLATSAGTQGLLSGTLAEEAYTNIIFSYIDGQAKDNSASAPPLVRKAALSYWVVNIVLLYIMREAPHCDGQWEKGSYTLLIRQEISPPMPPLLKRSNFIGWSM